MVKDEIGVNNERAKLLANFLNAFGLGLIGLGVLPALIAMAPPQRPDGSLTSPLLPLPDDKAQFFNSLLIESAPGPFADLPRWLVWLVIGLVMHATAHYVLGYIKKAKPHDHV